MTREFEELALDRHNYPTWVMYVKISLAHRGIYEAIVPPAETIVPLLEPYKYHVLYIVGTLQTGYPHVQASSQDKGQSMRRHVPCSTGTCLPA
jgi:hypothetical protein